MLGRFCAKYPPFFAKVAVFKYGSFEGERNGRYFTDLTEESFASIIQNIPELKIVKTAITQDVRPNRTQEKWLNLFLIKQ